MPSVELLLPLGELLSVQQQPIPKIKSLKGIAIHRCYHDLSTYDGKIKSTQIQTNHRNKFQHLRLTEAQKSKSDVTRNNKSLNVLPTKANPLKSIDIYYSNNNCYILKIYNDFALMAMKNFNKDQFITKFTGSGIQCVQFIERNTLANELYIEFCSERSLSPSEMTVFISRKENPNCYIIKTFDSGRVILSVYASSDVDVGEELSIGTIWSSKNSGPCINGLLNSQRDWFKDLTLTDIKNDIYQNISIYLNTEERYYMNNDPDLLVDTATLENEILEHFLGYQSNRVSIDDLVEVTIKLFKLNFNDKEFIKYTISCLNNHVSISQKVSILFNTCRLFILWWNDINELTTASKLERFAVCWSLSFNGMMEVYMNAEAWAKNLVISFNKFSEYLWQCLEAIGWETVTTVASYNYFLFQLSNAYGI
ncbi:10343_t:CDS:2 [Funneliformis caledonium]|uniref:10343_t:CDS:1 n=1 Tax=Funneliformis caledonium TaxID=1117310 RepID=A0A9N9AN46_9GLOM|nr:10343_t:CDS:2 [Funneliformis caledonium]